MPIFHVQEQGRELGPSRDKGKPAARRGRKAVDLLRETAWPPKVKTMKKLATTLLSALLLVAISATPAYAASLRISAKAISHGGSTLGAHIDFTAKVSPTARVKVAIYRNGRWVRTLTARKTTSGYKVKWDLRTAAGKRLAPGWYGYVVVATRLAARKTLHSRTKVPVAPVAPVVPVVPVAPPVKTPPAIGMVTLPPLVPIVDVTPAPPTPPVSPIARWLGFYVAGAPKDMAPMALVESGIAAPSPVINYFTNTVYGFDAALAGKVADHGSTPLITLEFWDPAKGVTQPELSLKAISGGALDTYLHTYARNAKAFGRTIWLRPFHEMNGDWYPWGGTVNGNTPADFITTWKHVKDIFTAEGATNVKFVWCPNTDSVPNTTANAISAYWPGDGYVDYMALDGYNWGGSVWRSFNGVFAAGYKTVTALSAKPLFIAETACTDAGDKAAWVTDMFKVIPQSLPRIVGVTWFSANKEHDWRADSSTAILGAFKLGVEKF